MPSLKHRVAPLSQFPFGVALLLIYCTLCNSLCLTAHFPVAGRETASLVGLVIPIQNAARFIIHLAWLVWSTCSRRQHSAHPRNSGSSVPWHHATGNGDCGGLLWNAIVIPSREWRTVRTLMDWSNMTWGRLCWCVCVRGGVRVGEEGPRHHGCLQMFMCNSSKLGHYLIAGRGFTLVSSRWVSWLISLIWAGRKHRPAQMSWNLSPVVWKMNTRK